MFDVKAFWFMVINNRGYKKVLAFFEILSHGNPHAGDGLRGETKRIRTVPRMYLNLLRRKACIVLSLLLNDKDHRPHARNRAE